MPQPLAVDIAAGLDSDQRPSSPPPPTHLGQRSRTRQLVGWDGHLAADSAAAFGLLSAELASQPGSRSRRAGPARTGRGPSPARSRCRSDIVSF